MRNFIECKIRFEKTMENGMNRKVTESYLVDALSFTEAEARIIEEKSPSITGEFQVTAVKQEKYSELFTSDEESADKYFKFKLNYLTVDKKGNVKKTAVYQCVQAAGLRDSIKKLDEGMKGTMVDYTIASVSETAIMDVYMYEA